ncbi:SDR family NAD(P)-dependent oxidoreductase [Streptomyces vietnamensis]|uniref:SDR family NAD(P)-dependent oxidoreductase n=1 Tax=Streptomyces vietnamensis TaxID=362257 RepID=UPI00378D0C9D
MHTLFPVRPKAGDQLAATARRPEQLADLFSCYGDRVRAVALDVTDPVAAENSVRAAVDAFGPLDVVVNNAGYANSAPNEEMAEDDFRAEFEANFFGVADVTRAALPSLREQRSGIFLQFSSLGGRVGGTPGMGAYQSAKFAVEGFSEVLANEVAPFGVKVVIVEPGAFRTDRQGSSMACSALSSARPVPRPRPCPPPRTALPGGPPFPRAQWRRAVRVRLRTRTG